MRAAVYTTKNLKANIRPEKNKFISELTLLNEAVQTKGQEDEELICPSEDEREA